MGNDRPKLELSGPQILGGALAAASAAVASSWLGVAGTVLGAVIVSLVVSIGSALYTHSLERSSRAIRESLPVSPILPSRNASLAEGAGSTAVLASVGAADSADTSDVTASEEPGREPERRTSSKVSWRTVGVSALASLALAAAVLTGFETFVGKPASSITGAGDGGGTTVSRLVGHDPSSSDQSDPVAPTQPETTSDGGSSSSQSGSTDQGTPSQPTDTGPTGHTSDPTTPTEPGDSTGAPPTSGDPTPSDTTDPTPTEPTTTE